MNAWFTKKIGKKRPTWGFILAHPAHFLALGCGSGLAWFSPGTFGTLFGWLAFVCLDPIMTTSAWACLILVSFVAGCWFCSLAGKALGVADHGSIVWDEIVAIWLVLFVGANVFNTPLEQLLCVGVFRFFDIVKPPPIAWFDSHWKNGFGVMVDDIVAGLIALLCLAVLAHFFNF